MGVMDMVVYFGVFLYALGIISSFVGGIMLFIAAFRTGIGWGLSVLFLPFAPLIYIIMHWSEAWPAMKVQLLAFLMLVIAVVLFVVGAGKGGGTAVTGQLSGLQAQLEEQMEVVSNEDAVDERETATTTTTTNGTGIVSDAWVEPQSEWSETNLVGATYWDVVGILGTPRGTMKDHKGQTVYYYEKWELISADGKVISEQHKAAVKEVKKKKRKRRSSRR